MSNMTFGEIARHIAAHKKDGETIANLIERVKPTLDLTIECRQPTGCNTDYILKPRCIVDADGRAVDVCALYDAVAKAVHINNGTYQR